MSAPNVLVVASSGAAATAAYLSNAGCNVTTSEHHMAMALLDQQCHQLVVAEVCPNTCNAHAVLDLAKQAPLAVVCRGALPACLTNSGMCEKANVVDIFTSTLAEDPNHVQELLHRVRTNTLHKDLHAYLERHVQQDSNSWDTATQVVMHSSASEQHPELVLSAEYSRQGSVTQEPWDVSCDNLELLIVDEDDEPAHGTHSHGSTEMTGGTMMETHSEFGSVHNGLALLDEVQHVPQCTDVSVVGGKRELESCLTSQPDAKRQQTRTSMRTKRLSQRARQAAGILSPSTPAKTSTPLKRPPLSHHNPSVEWPAAGPHASMMMVAPGAPMMMVVPAVAPEGMMPMGHPTAAEEAAQVAKAAEAAIACVLEQHQQTVGKAASVSLPLGLSLDVGSVLSQLCS